MNTPRNPSQTSTRQTNTPGTVPESADQFGTLTVNGHLSLASRGSEDESMTVAHAIDPEAGLVTGLHLRGDLLLGHTPAQDAGAACAFLAVAGGVRGSTPPALRVDGAIASPPRADMLFVLRGRARAGMFVLWSGHLLGDGTLELHEGACATPSSPHAGDTAHAGSIGAFLGPNLEVQPFGCEAVAPSNPNARLSQEAEYGALHFDMGAVMQRSTLRLRVGPRDWNGRTSDMLRVQGTLHLGGSKLIVASAFQSLPTMLKPGDSFPLVQASTLCGELAAVETPNLPNGLRFELERTWTTLSLRVVRK